MDLDERDVGQVLAEATHFHILTGVERVVQYEDRSGDTVFKCQLCDVKFLQPDLVQHIIGQTHRSNYLKSCSTLQYEEIVRQSRSEKHFSKLVDEEVKEMNKENDNSVVSIRVVKKPKRRSSVGILDTTIQSLDDLMKIENLTPPIAESISVSNEELCRVSGLEMKFVEKLKSGELIRLHQTSRERSKVEKLIKRCNNDAVAGKGDLELLRERKSQLNTQYNQISKDYYSVLTAVHMRINREKKVKVTEKQPEVVKEEAKPKEDLPKIKQTDENESSVPKNADQVKNLKVVMKNMPFVDLTNQNDQVADKNEECVKSSQESQADIPACDDDVDDDKAGEKTTLKQITVDSSNVEKTTKACEGSTDPIDVDKKVSDEPTEKTAFEESKDEKGESDEKTASDKTSLRRKPPPLMALQISRHRNHGYHDAHRMERIRRMEWHQHQHHMHHHHPYMLRHPFHAANHHHHRHFLPPPHHRHYDVMHRHPYEHYMRFQHHGGGGYFRSDPRFCEDTFY